MITGRPKITTMLTVFALIIYAGVLIINIQTATIEGESINSKLALEAARLEVEVAELEFAIGRYMAYVNAGIKLEELRIAMAETEERIAELQAELTRPGSTTTIHDVNALERTKDHIEQDILMAEVELIHLQTELDLATESFNAVDVSNVIAEIARTHLGLELPDEIVIR